MPAGGEQWVSPLDSGGGSSGTSGGGSSGNGGGARPLSLLEDASMVQASFPMACAAGGAYAAWLRVCRLEVFTGPPPLPLLAHTLRFRCLSTLSPHLQASQELQELCRLQLGLLVSALQLSLQASILGAGGSVIGSLDEDGPLRQQLLLDPRPLRCTAYCRAPGSLRTGNLQLQLVAASDAGAGDAMSAAAAGAAQAQRFLFLGQDGMGGGGMGGGGLHDQEQWILEQPVIVLPDSGGLVLPLAHNGFLVGLLVVERCADEDPAGPAAAGAVAGPSPAGSEAAAAAAGADAAAGEAGTGSSSSSGAGRMPPPPACLLFRSAELQLLKQTAGVLSLACAMDLRAALERVGAAVRQRQASALVQAVSGRLPG